MKFKLTEAFKNKNEKDILKLSAEIGHYIADSNVPLHTTKNYNGQLTNQVGIHGFWESRLPELFIQDYDFFIGQAIYVSKVQETIWQGVYAAHAALDSVLTFESILNAKYPEDKKYSIEERNGINIKVYSIDYAKSYHDMLKNQIERQMIASITMVGNIWYTCWVDAGQPDLNSFKIKTEIDIKEKQEIINSSTDNCSH